MQIGRLRKSFATARTGGLYTSGDLNRGLQLLESLGLIESDLAGSVVRPTSELEKLHLLPEDVFVQLIVQRYLAAYALWLRAFAIDEAPTWGAIVPLDADRLLTSVYEDPHRRAAIVRGLARKVDTAALAELGARGERAVAEACRMHLIAYGRAHLADRVVHVAEFDDTCGYDVLSPDCLGSEHRQEVKTTRAPSGKIEFFLSRHEAEIGASDPAWSLVIAREDVDGAIEIVGWLQYSDLSSALPADAPARDLKAPWGTWSSVRISVSEDTLVPGLPIASRHPG